MIYLVEIEGHDGTAVQTLRFASEGYTTEPTDTPPNTHYAPQLSTPGNYERTLFGAGTTSGEVAVGFGEVVLVNADGGLDHIVGWGFGKRPLHIYAMEPGAPFSARTLLLSGTAEQAVSEWRKVTFRMRDRLELLRQAKVSPNKYAGTTITNGDSAEGRPEDLKDRPKPILRGKALKIPVPCSNVFDLIFDVNDGPLASVDAVEDRGVPITYSGQDYPTIAALRAATIPGGQYATAKALGKIRTGSAPTGLLTVDATEGGTAADRTAAQVVKRLLTGPGGLTAADLDAASIAALDALNSAEVGVWIGPEETDVLTVVGQVLDSVGAWIVPSRTGVFRVGRFGAPAGAPVAVIDETTAIDRGGGLARVPTGDQGRGVPAHRVTVGYRRHHVVQDANALAGSVTAARRAELAQEYRTVKAETPAVLVQHPLAPELRFDTLLVTEAAAQAEAARRLALHSVHRDRYQIPVHAWAVGGVDLGQTVRLVLPRFGLSTGRDFVVIGMTEDFSRGVTTLDLWG